MSNKKKYDQFNLPPVGPNLCDFYGQYIGFGGGNGGASGVTVRSIAQSALFNDTDGQSLNRTQVAGSATVWTFSSWIFKCGTRNQVFLAFGTGGAEGQLGWSAADKLYIFNGSTTVGLTTRVFRDIGWYHIHFAYNTGLGGTEKAKLSVNGQLIDDYDTDNRAGAGSFEDANTNTQVVYLGNNGSSDAINLQGYMAETVILDGTASAVSNFGEYDSSGQYWTPKSSADILSLTFGNNGVYLDNATNPQTDASGEGHNFTNTGTVVNSPHTPTNIFALLNPLMAGSTGSFTNANRTATIPPVNTSVISSLPMPATGKWYCEFNFATIHGYAVVGVSQMNASTWLENSAHYISPSSGAIFNEEGTLFTEGSTSGDVITVATDTIYGLMWDADNSILKITDGSDTYQCAYTVNDIGIVGSVPLGFIFAISSGSVTGNVSVNFGDPPFSISSGNTDGNGQGNFEFAPPTGYLALNTSNLAASTTDTRTASDITKYFETILYEGNGAGQRLGQFLPFTDTYTVAKSALFSTANADLTRGSMDGTGGTWTFSAWVKRTEPATGGTDANFIFTTASNAGLSFSNNSTADLISWYSGSYTASSTAVVDQSQWFNYVFKNDGGTGTVFLNGVEVLGSLTVHAADATMAVGSYNGDSNELDGYMAEVVFIDGLALAPTSFAKTETSTNRWVPIDVSGLTYNGNSFYLNFANSSDLGNDVSGNNKDFTNNVGVLSSADSPTTNIAVLNDNDASSGITLSSGNRTFAAGTNHNVHGTIPLPSSGKYYWEVNLDTASSASVGVFLALNGGTEAMTTAQDSWGTAVALYRSNNGNVYVDGTSIFTLSGVSSVNTTWQVAVDLDNDKMWFGIDNTWMSSTGASGGNPSAGTGAVLERDFTGYKPLFGNYNNTMTVDFDSANWGYTAPTGYVALTQDNLPSTNQFITAFSWIKNRDANDSFLLADRVRGINKYVHSNNAVVEETEVDTFQQFFKGGIQIGSDDRINTANESFVFWNWMIEATGSGASNTDGSINTTSTLADQTFGLSISTYAGTGSNATVGHGLGAVPRLIFIKNRGVDDSWAVYFGDNTDYLVLNTATGLVDDATMWQDTTPTSTVWSIGTNHQVNASGENYIAYCFANSQFISVGSFLGNENTNGPFVSTVNSLGIPIQPSFLLVKNSTQSRSWTVWDNKRSPFNISQNVSELDYAASEASGSTYYLDILTGGFKPRGTHELQNGAEAMIYMAMGTPLIDTSGRIIAGR